MIDGLKPYGTYKRSGSKWLGDVPSHWEVRNLRTLIRKRNERNRVDLPLLSVARERGVFVRSMTDATENHNVIPDDLSNYKVARSGNLVINKMKAWQGSMGIAPCDGIVSPAYFVFDLQIANRIFAQRLLRSKPYVAHFAQASDGVRVGQWDLSVPGMREIPVLLPTYAEQLEIVKFLDNANRTINRFVVAKQARIQLLNEQRQSIVQQAVTRSLEPTAECQESGIPWVGVVPKRWLILRAKYLFKEIDERSVSGIEELLSVSHLTGVTPRSEKNITMFKAASYIGHKICRPGDLAVNTMWAWMGALGVAHETGIISPAYAVYRVRDKYPMLGQYVELLLRTRAYTSNFMCRSTGVRASRLRLYPEEFFKVPILVPPINEQLRIVEFLDGETASLTAAIARTEREVAVMQEYRTRLTADIVTGKLDIREAASKLLDLPSEEALLVDGDLSDGEQFEPEVDDTDE